MPTLSWRHHTLIQALLSRGPIREPEFHSLFTHITSKPPGKNQQLFDDFVRKINEELSYVHFELRACRNQYSGSVYYGVVNNVGDDHSKLGTKYTVPQITFYKAIIEAIIQEAAARGSISNIDALNVRLEDQVASTESESQSGPTQIPAAIRNFTLSQKEKTLEELIKDKWLSASADSRIGLGVRSFFDLRSWFRSNEVRACEVCNEAAVKAECCQNEECNVRMHEYCLKQKFSKRKGDQSCSGCGTQWHYVVAKAELIEEDDESHPPQDTQHSESSRRKKLRTGQGVTDSRAGCSSGAVGGRVTRSLRTSRAS